MKTDKYHAAIDAEGDYDRALAAVRRDPDNVGIIAEKKAARRRMVDSLAAITPEERSQGRAEGRDFFDLQVSEPHASR